MTYADTVLRDIGSVDGGIEVHADSYEDSKLQLLFKAATLIKDMGDGPERVEYSQLIRLENDRRRLILYDDEKTIFFEIEYEDCERKE